MILREDQRSVGFLFFHLFVLVCLLHKATAFATKDIDQIPLLDIKDVKNELTLVIFSTVTNSVEVFETTLTFMEDGNEDKVDAAEPLALTTIQTQTEPTLDASDMGLDVSSVLNHSAESTIISLPDFEAIQKLFNKRENDRDNLLPPNSKGSLDNLSQTAGEVSKEQIHKEIRTEEKNFNPAIFLPNRIPPVFEAQCQPTEYRPLGPMEYNSLLASILARGDSVPPVHPQHLLDSFLASVVGQVQPTWIITPRVTSIFLDDILGISRSTSFSFSFAPEPTSTISYTTTFSTTATAPAAKNTIAPDANRPEAYHYKNATTFEVGALIPLSVNGTALLSGVQFAESFRCAINLVNSNVKMLQNTLLTYLIQDSGINPNVAANQAFLLERRGLSFVIGPYDYDSLPPVANLYNNISLPFMSYGAAGVQYSNGTVYPSFFRTIPSDLSTARAMAETMVIFGWNYVAAIFSTDSYGQSGRAALLQQIGRQRLKVTCVNQIDPGSVRGLSSFADCMSGSQASIAVLWMGPDDAANVMSYLYQNASNSRITFMAPDRWALINNPSTFNDTIPRTNYSFPISYVDGTIGFVPQIGSLSLYQACMSAVDPSNTNYPAFNQVWQREFRCIINASDTVPLCPADYSERVFNCRCTGQESLNDLPVDPKVNYVIDSVNVFAGTLDKMLNNCTVFQVGPFCNRSIIANSDIVLALTQLSFNGLTGNIAFNQTRPDRRRSFLDIYQYNALMIPNQIGFWNLSGPYLSKSRLQFKTYPAIPVSRLIPEDTTFSSSFWTALVAIMAAIGVFCCLFFMVFYLVFRKTRVVRRAGILFIIFFLLGIALVFLSLIAWTFVQDTAVCTTKTVLGMVGFGLIVGCILAKCQRYYRSLLNIGHIAPVMTTLEFLAWWSIPMIIDSILAVVYVIGSGSLPTAQITQSKSDNTYVYISCVPGTKNFGLTVVWVFLITNFLFMLVCAVGFFLCRHLLSPYKESTYLFLICLDFIVLLLLLIPLYYTVGDRRGSALQTFLLRSLGELFALFLTLGLMFVPKMIYTIRGVQIERREHEEEEFSGTRGSVTALTTEATTFTGRTRQINYAELSSDESASDLGTSNVEQETPTTTVAGVSSTPRFISENISQNSGGPAGANVTASTTGQPAATPFSAITRSSQTATASGNTTAWESTQQSQTAPSSNYDRFSMQSEN